MADGLRPERLPVHLTSRHLSSRGFSQTAVFVECSRVVIVLFCALMDTKMMTKRSDWRLSP